jgi:hypothetical protein
MTRTGNSVTASSWAQNTLLLPLPSARVASQLVSARVPVRQISGLRKFLEVDLVASLSTSYSVGMSEKWMVLRIAESILKRLALPYIAKKVRAFQRIISNFIVVFLVHTESWVL